MCVTMGLSWWQGGIVYIDMACGVAQCILTWRVWWERERVLPVRRITDLLDQIFGCCDRVLVIENCLAQVLDGL